MMDPCVCALFHKARLLPMQVMHGSQTGTGVRQGNDLRQAAAGGYTVYSFCSERGVWPCTPAQSPLLTVWYH
jgi:hypothetical protein